ncbi:MAG: GntR family transcriptional regulator [Desulfobacterales bacterium]|nr:GntR family transcriptional regulator [Desulfobacterales bacterium]
MTKLEKNQGKAQEDLTQKALVGIKKMLFHNEIVAGQKLPFRELASKLGMSATPVIQALKFLEFQGLVNRKPNKGYYIEPVTLSEVEEIYKFREQLEVALVRETIQRLDDEGIALLRQSHQDYLDSLKSIFINEKLLKNMGFHITLASLSGQHIRLQSLKTTFDLLHLKYKNSLQYVTSEQSDRTEHSKIFEAVMDRDGDTASQILSNHISHSRKHAILNLKRMMEEKEEYLF